MIYEWNHLKILIVEDTPSSILFYKSALKKTGAKILVATDGIEAIQYVKENPDINVILMDIHMPNLDGLEATTRIKEINPQILIIIQTAYVLFHTEEECLDAGADVFLEKPISLSRLLNIVNDRYYKK